MKTKRRWNTNALCPIAAILLATGANAHERDAPALESLGDLVKAQPSAGPGEAALQPVLQEQDARTSQWEFLLAPYLWAVGMDGDVAAGGEEIPVDVSFSDILDDFNGGGSLFFEARNGPWGLLLDGTLVNLESEDEVQPGVDATTETRIGLFELDGTYRIAADSEYDLLLGVRVLDLDNEISIPGVGDGDGGLASIQAVLGARGRWRAGESWVFSLRADLGLGSSSDSSWQLFGLVGYEFGKHWGLSLGYRAMGMDVEDGQVALDATMHGALLGLVFGW